MAIHRQDLADYLAKLVVVDPDTLSLGESKAYWLNLYNAGALLLATEAFGTGTTSVLEIPDAFTRNLVTVGGEGLSLDAIEHGKLRRLGDPRVHGALVCGSLSCPTLRPEPYEGARVEEQLDDQMRVFLAHGGAVGAGDGSVSLSRVFLWYGADFVRPHRMPSFLPVSRGRLLDSIERWLPDHLRGHHRVSFQAYDWALGCSIA